MDLENNKQDDIYIENQINQRQKWNEQYVSMCVLTRFLFEKDHVKFFYKRNVRLFEWYFMKYKKCLGMFLEYFSDDQIHHR